MRPPGMSSNRSTEIPATAKYMDVRRNDKNVDWLANMVRWSASRSRRIKSLFITQRYKNVHARTPIPYITRLRYLATVTHEYNNHEVQITYDRSSVGHRGRYRGPTTPYPRNALAIGPGVGRSHHARRKR